MLRLKYHSELKNLLNFTWKLEKKTDHQIKILLQKKESNFAIQLRYLQRDFMSSNKTTEHHVKRQSLTTKASNDRLFKSGGRGRLRQKDLKQTELE